MIKKNYFLKFSSSIFLTLTLLVLTPTQAQLPKFEKDDPLPANLFVELAKLANPAVVNISTSQMPKQPQFQLDPNDPYSLFLRRFFGDQLQQQNQQPRHSLGTGFIIRKDGLIITNNHVVDAADIIKVQISESGKEYEAQVIGKDKRTDLALIKISVDKPLPILKLGSSSTLEVGEWVAAFGNPYGHGHTMTKGIVSAKGRSIQELNKFEFIQTDASINPGNSGGPLVNMKGEVIGVNTAIDARAQGIGFAIPIDQVKSVITQLEKNGHIKRGFLGVQPAALNERAVRMLNLKNDKGALVMNVVQGSSAEKAKIKPYDVIIKVNDKVINTPQELFISIQDLEVNKVAKIRVIRNGKEKDIKVTIMEHPDDKGIRKPKLTKRRYKGQKAPFDLGFNVSNFNEELSDKYNLPRLRQKHPIIIKVNPQSKAANAGLSEGDVILDVNRRLTTKASEVIRYLKKGEPNYLRVLKRENVVLIEIKP